MTELIADKPREAPADAQVGGRRGAMKELIAHKFRETPADAQAGGTWDRVPRPDPASEERRTIAADKFVWASV